MPVSYDFAQIISNESGVTVTVRFCEGEYVTEPLLDEDEQPTGEAHEVYRRTSVLETKTLSFNPGTSREAIEAFCAALLSTYGDPIPEQDP